MTAKFSTESCWFYTKLLIFGGGGGEEFADSVREKCRKFAQKSETQTQINRVRELTLGWVSAARNSH